MQEGSINEMGTDRETKPYGDEVFAQLAGESYLERQSTDEFLET